jgi:hypothetical protein
MVPFASRLLRRTLLVGTWIYLLVPCVLFSWSWLRPSLSVLLTTLLSAGCAVQLTGIGATRRSQPQREDTGATLARTLIGFAPLCIVVFITGAGGMGPQSWDWAKHNAILRDLIERAWPVVYATERDPVALVYYIAYYLPAAIVGKLAGWKAANLALFAWTLVGAALAYLWVVLFTRGAALTVGLVLALFSGMDALGAIALQPGKFVELLNVFDLEIPTARYWVYPSNVSLLAFVPHQALAGWLGAALLIDAVYTKDAGFPFLLAIGASALWSPLATIGLLPLAVYAAWRSGALSLPGFGRQLSLPNMAGGLLAAVLLFYFLSRYGPYSLSSNFYPPPENMKIGAFYFMPAGLPPATFIARYLEFVVIEFLLLTLLVWRSLPWGETRNLVLLAGALLLVLPLFHYGNFNDLAMRASIPALFIVQLGLVQAWRKGSRSSPSALLLALLFVIGALAPVNMLRLNTGHIAERGYLHRTAPWSAVAGLLPILQESSKIWNFTDQYVGSIDTVFFRHLAADFRPQ